MVGVTLAKITDTQEAVSFTIIREPEQNPDPNYTAIAALLWREEALNILEEIDEAKGVRSKKRSIIYQRLAEALNEQDLKKKVRECLKARASWRSDLSLMTSGD